MVEGSSRSGVGCWRVRQSEEYASAGQVRTFTWVLRRCERDCGRIESGT